jgi:hypothetical protein
MTVSDTRDHSGTAADIADLVITTQTRLRSSPRAYARPVGSSRLGLTAYATNRFSRILRKSVAKLP